MNINILLPRRKKSNPNWLKKLFRRISNYRYFRSIGYGVSSAWFMSGTVI